MQKNTNTIYRLTSVVLLAASLCAAQDIKTVIAEGVGSDPQGAAQNAAESALTNVVGSFIDANKQLEKRTEIRDGIRSQTTQIRTDIKEYSQGSIQSFEIVETRKDGPLFRVTAKVGVRLAEFRAYVKKLAEGETAVGGGLFAQMSTTQKQNQSLGKILSERILAVVTGEVVRFSVSKPIPFQQSRFAGQRFVGGSMIIPSLARRFGPDTLVALDVTATLDDAFIANLTQTLDSVAASKKRVSTNVNTSTEWMMYQKSGTCQYFDRVAGGANPTFAAVAQRFGVRPTGSDRASTPEPSGRGADSTFCIPLLDTNPGTATVYRFSNVGSEFAFGRLRTDSLPALEVVSLVSG